MSTCTLAVDDYHGDVIVTARFRLRDVPRLARLDELERSVSYFGTDSLAEFLRRVAVLATALGDAPLPARPPHRCEHGHKFRPSGFCAECGERDR